MIRTIILILSIVIFGCSSTQPKVGNNTKLIITEKKDEKKTEVECFCPEDKSKKTANVIQALGTVISSITNIFF